ncbi:restriction endonuclease [uncultured Methanobacterium sp.]|uniref:restriction endonuclease n=1 Tax=uncultured Methanobacterium sp. TaxID=176306 RepID=UPI002AA62C5C|nr:restriction endonuclease [uncultured Methanobacterium sp.]
MAEDFSFDHLSATEFENFCHELLDEIGFINIDWRKGTGYDSSPSDDGRDIECEREIKDENGSKIIEKIFVECKHYKKGVPVGAITNAIDWANAEKPSTLLIIVSNFLSNPTKRYIDTYKRNNNPSFDIQYWEKTHLKKLTLNRWNLLKKYDIPNLEFPFIDLIHPAHLWYFRDPPMNSMGYLFELIEGLDNKKRDHIFSFLFRAIIKPRSKKPTFKKGEKMRDLLLDKVDYESFKSKTQFLSNLVYEPFLITSMINFTLEHMFRLADKTEMDIVIQNQRRLIKDFKKVKTGEVDLGFGETFTEDQIQKKCDSIIKSTQKRIDDMPEIYNKHYELYIYFCNNIVSELFKEDIFDVLTKKDI